MPFPLTQEQRRVVENRGGELLVSAAAGSGKTRVLVERLLDRVTREGLDIDDFLVITYTRAAAAELRERIAQELNLRLAQNPNDRHLRRQTTLVYQAQISTIHSFCSALLRESGHRIGLDPDFRLCDEGEGQVLMVRVLEDTLDGQYQNLDPQGDFAALVDTMAAGRDDSALEQIVLDMFGRIQSHPDPRRWLREQKAAWALTGVTDVGKTPWGALLLTDARRQAAYCRQRLCQALSLCDRDEVLSINYAPSLSASIQGVENLLTGLDRGWDAAVACLPVEFPTAGRKKGVQDQETAQRVKDIRAQCKKDLDKLAELLEGDSAQLLEDLRLAAPAVRGLMDLVELFQDNYRREKEKRSILDFSDLEHLSVQLLLDPDTGGTTPLAQYWSGKFAEVMVDEYQDTNQVQNAIFTAVSDGGRKLFMVGDVKQSIYRFRLADPTIFLSKYQRFPNWEQAQEGQPRTIVLSRNFRSRPQVLLGCNDLFRSIMSAEFGELDYTDDQALVPGANFPPAEDRAVELALLDLSETGEENQEKTDKNLLEARWAAGRIRALLDQGFLVGPEGEQRPLEPSDVMILLRSPGVVLHYYIRALGEQGIPWAAEGGEDIFQSTEVNVALAILQIVDNPRQDVALIAALRSPVYGFSADKLAQLRAGSEGDFYQALVHAAQEGDQECQSFLDELEQLRFGAGDKTCRQLIWHIYERTNLLGLFGAMDGGQARQNNLLALYNLAGQLEESGCRSLFQFLLRLDRLRQLGSKLPLPAAGQGGGVSIMSIHRSKGLEKPVVLLCGLSRRLNREDMQRPVLFHPQLGVGPRGLDRERMVEYPTLARKAVARKLEREMMAEELRLLYVAMTRAREKLILSVTLTEGAKALERLGEDLAVPPVPMALERQQSVGAWVLLHALTRPEAAFLRAWAGLPEVEGENFGPAWDMTLVDGSALLQRPETPGRFVDKPAQEGEDPDALLEQLRWRYPDQAGADIPSKLTATQLKGRALDQETAEEAEALTAGEEPDKPVRRPDFITKEKGLTPSQRGTALHLAMQYLTLRSDHTPQTVGEELDRLVAGGFLTKQQGEAADRAHLAAFFTSPLGQAMAAAPVCRREFKFSVLVPASDYYDQAEAGEQVLLQGVIDAWFDTGEELVVVDFKSDRVTPQTQRARAEEYRPQLQAYSRALEEITGKPVGRNVLWFFATDSEEEL
jgi:ATP-dependent helicase/nuclease subunit A